MGLAKSTKISKAAEDDSFSNKWAHTANNLTLAWLIISIPLVIWDTGFVLLRPYTVPGGSLHWPIWVPYELYMRTDYIYGWKAIEEHNGFTAAQAFMNIPESLLYAYYLYVVYSHGTQMQDGSRGVKPVFWARRYVGGTRGTLALMAAFTGAVMTFAKTVLYGLNEAFSGWSNVGHNSWIELITLWIIPNGAWLVASAVMTYEFGMEIFRGLPYAAGVGVPEEILLMKLLLMKAEEDL